MMIGNEIKQVSGVISPAVPEAALRQAWENRPEAGMAPRTTLVTDGQKFTITYRNTWQDETLRHAFLMVVQRVEATLKPTGRAVRRLKPGLSGPNGRF